MLVGLTGGVGSGKSAVAEMIREMGVPVVDADVLAREVVEPGTPGFSEVVVAFGPGVVTPDGSLDRRRLAGIVFADTEARRRLEAIVHPRVRARMAEEVARLRDRLGRDALVVLDIPLLLETGARRAYDLAGVIVVWADRETQIRRLREREGLSREEIEQRLAAQIPLDEKRAIADWVIDNSGSLDETRPQARAVVERLLGRSA